MSEASANAGGTGASFTPSFSFSEDKKSVTLETAPGEKTTVPAEKFLATYHKGVGFDAQGETLGKARKQGEASEQRAKAYEGLFGKHYEVLRGIKDEAKFQAALAASLDALKGKPGKVAAAQDDPLSFLGDESAATEPPKGLTMDEVRAEFDQRDRARELRGELMQAMDAKNVPQGLRKMVFNEALIAAPNSDKPIAEVVGEIAALIETEMDAKRNAAEAAKVAEKGATFGNTSLMGRGATSSVNADPRSKAAVDSPEFRAYLKERLNSLSSV